MQNIRKPLLQRRGFLRFKGLIWHSPEVYFRFKGLLPK